MGLGLLHGCFACGVLFGCPDLGQVRWLGMLPRQSRKSFVLAGLGRFDLRSGSVPDLLVWGDAMSGYHRLLCR